MRPGRQLHTIPRRHSLVICIKDSNSGLCDGPFHDVVDPKGNGEQAGEEINLVCCIISEHIQIVVVAEIMLLF